MPTAADHFIGMAKESTYGTAVTPTRCYPFVDGTEGDFDVRPRIGKGVTGGNGRRTQLAGRGFVTAGQGTVKVMAELETKGAGVLLDSAFGVSTVTAMTGGAQINFHTSVTGMVLPSMTIQLVKVDNSGANVVETYRGCTATKITIEQPEDDIATIEVEYDALAMTRATAAITPTYATGPTLIDAIHCVTAWGGTYVPATTGALATLSGATTAFRSWKVEIDQKASVDRWVLQAGGLRAQPLVGTPEIKFSGTVEFGAGDPIGADYLAGTKRGFLATWTTPEVVGPGFAQAQVAIPSIFLSKGLAQVKQGETPTTFDIEGTVMSDGTNRDVQVSYRTSDTAL